jgi:uncharacterized protein
MYINRSIYPEIIKRMEEDDILLITGPRQAGKTTLLCHVQEALETEGKVCRYITLENASLVESFNKDPLNLLILLGINLKEKTFVFIDEIQYLKNPSNFLKLLYDEYRGKIKLIVTGSSAFYIDKGFKDSLVGRKYIFQLNPLSLKEFVEFKEGNDVLANRLPIMSWLEKEQFMRYYDEYIKYGGYPRVVLAKDHEDKVLALSEIVSNYIKKDVIEAGLKSEDVYHKILRLLASQTGSLVNKLEIAHTLEVSTTLVDNYLYVMSKSFHIVLISPFSNSPRVEIRKMPKVYFIDIGLRNYLINNFESFTTRLDKGVVLENLVFRSFYEKDTNSLFLQYWRSLTGAEVDFIIRKEAAYEVKVQAKHLNKGNYKLFMEKYPKMKFTVISFDVDKNEFKDSDFSVINVWDL